MKTKLEIIEETAAAYPNNNARAVNPGGMGAFYQYRTNEGKECGVGRCLLEPWLYAGSIDILTLQRSGSLVPFTQDLFKEEYRGHEVSFWTDIQGFHDHDCNFTESGLTEDGEEYLAKLKLKYA